MRNEFAVSLGILMLLANSGLSQETGVLRESAPFHNDSAAVKNPARPEAIIDHLLRAAEHLEAAGRADDATRLRDEAKRLTLGNDLLGRKEAELACLQQEVDRLRALAGQDAEVLLEFVTIEVDRRKLGLKTREFEKLIGWNSPVNAGAEAARVRSPMAVADANPMRMPLLRELREKGALRVLSEPTLASVSGRPASFLSGGEIPLQARTEDGTEIRYVWYGTRIEVVSVLVPENRIRLNADIELRTLPDRERATDDESNAPRFNSRRLQTEVEIQLGQTLTLLVDSTPADGSGSEPGSGPGTSDATEKITFITPRLARIREDAPIVPISAEDVLPFPISPERFAPDDDSAFGPPVPVLKRRGARD
jgi:hypothetical protein